MCVYVRTYSIKRRRKSQARDRHVSPDVTEMRDTSIRWRRMDVVRSDGMLDKDSGWDGI